jgi:2-dehydropantoate 2-reductase
MTHDMRHAVLGSGGVGGLIAAALARTGVDVVVLMRPQTLASYGGVISVQSTVLGEFEATVPAVSELDRGVDAVWVTSKATGLVEALTLAPPERVGDSLVIPLLNGVDHMRLLRERYPNVIAGAIRVESERVAPFQIRQSSPFIRAELAGAEPIAADLRAAGIDCRVRVDELSLLWEKLAFLAPVALATTALDAPLGGVRDDPRFLGCVRETLAIARAEGAHVDEPALDALLRSVPDQMRSSMQKDVTAGRLPETDAIAGPIVRGGARHGIPVPHTQELSQLVERRSPPRTPGSRERR